MLAALEDSDLAIHDAHIADEQLHIIGDSYFSIVRPSRSLCDNIAHCSALGCCMAFRRELLEAALPFPRTGVTHDLWLMLTACRGWRISIVNEPLLLYRKHEGSQTTSGSHSHYSMAFKLRYRLRALNAVMRHRSKSRATSHPNDCEHKQQNAGTECPTPLAILMATYNGEQYIAQQIDSIISQSYSQWTLYICDDGSKDASRNIIADYTSRYPNRIIALDLPQAHGACRNFMQMLEHVEADYTMFCDQDDVWHSDKIEQTMQAMRQAEAHYGTDDPIVVHSDLRVVDATLQELCPSFWLMSDIRPAAVKRLKDMCMVNPVTGCTMMLNAAARQSTRHMTAATLMHDAWITLCTLYAGGHIVVVGKPLIDYRQHGRNTIGAIDQRQRGMAYRLRNITATLSANRQTLEQVREFEHVSWPEYIYLKIKYRLT